MNKKLQSLFALLTRETCAIYYILIPTAIALLYVAFQNIDIGFLQLHSIDEYVFHGSVRHMYSGLFGGSKLSGLFGYGFYQYGFIYFFINLMGIAPALATNHTALAIAIPRIITSLSALLSLVVIYKFARLTFGALPATAITLVFVTMPAFWYNATWFHPDWSMTLFLLVFAYFLARDKGSFTRYFYYAVGAYGLAVAFKYQAITALPLLGLYIIYPAVTKLGTSTLVHALRRIFGSLVAILGIFIVCNPYILHPMGWRAFSEAFIGNMQSNATNHGVAAAATLTDKINFGIGDFYMNVIFLFVLVVGALWLSLRYFKKPTVSLDSILAINFLINLGYLFYFVNKAWQTYYLPVIMLGLLSVFCFLQSFKLKQQLLILASIVLIQVVSYATSYVPLLTNYRDTIAPDFITYSKTQIFDLNHFIETELTGKTNEHSVILISAYTPFPYQQLQIPYENVEVIFGALTEGSIDLKTYLVGQRNYWGNLKPDSELAKSFKIVDYIILRKDIPYIQTSRILAIRDKTAYEDAARIVTNLYSGHYAFEVMAENDTVVIFKKRNN